MGSAFVIPYGFEVCLTINDFTSLTPGERNVPALFVGPLPMMWIFLWSGTMQPTLTFHKKFFKHSANLAALLQTPGFGRGALSILPLSRKVCSS